MKESYAQVGEDLVVDHYLSERMKGYYVDIGAYEPMFLSNTYLFYKRGWTGVCVEPNSLLANKYREMRPNDRFFTEACGEGELKFKLSDEHSALSSCGDVGVPVKTRPLKEYMAMLPHVDLLSVDAEGSELKVMHTNDWNLYRPSAIIVENIDYQTKKKNTEVMDYLHNQGYRLVCDNSINAIYIEEKLYKTIFLIK